MKGQREEAPRRMYIRKGMYEKLGYTPGCEGCRRMKAGMAQRPHEEGCRRRMEEAMQGDEEGKNIIEHARKN